MFFVENGDQVTPETPANGHHHELGVDESAADGGGNFLRALHAQTHVAVVVADKDEGLMVGGVRMREPSLGGVSV